MSKIAVLARNQAQFDDWKARSGAGSEAVLIHSGSGILLEYENAMEFASILCLPDWAMGYDNPMGKLTHLRRRLQSRGDNLMEALSAEEGILREQVLSRLIDVVPEIASAFQAHGVSLPLYHWEALGAMVDALPHTPDSFRTSCIATLGYHLQLLARRYRMTLGNAFGDRAMPPFYAHWQMTVLRHTPWQMIADEFRQHWRGVRFTGLREAVEALQLLRAHNTPSWGTDRFRRMALETLRGRFARPEVPVWPLDGTPPPFECTEEETVPLLQPGTPDTADITMVNAEFMEPLERVAQEQRLAQQREDFRSAVQQRLEEGRQARRDEWIAQRVQERTMRRMQQALNLQQTDLDLRQFMREEREQRRRLPRGDR